jgi:hypothetical protein
MAMSKRENLLNKKLKVINIGIETFVQDLKRQGVEVVHVDWRPPAGGDVEILKLLDKLEEGVDSPERDCSKRLTRKQ